MREAREEGEGVTRKFGVHNSYGIDLLVGLSNNNNTSRARRRRVIG